MNESNITRIESAPGVHVTPNPHEVHPTIAFLASIMDDFIQVPGTNFRIGLDGIIGLIPIIGDLLTLVVAAVFMREAERLGVSRWTKARMYGNYLVDTVVGMVPIFGDAFDFAFKANRRNLQLLQEHLDKNAETGGMARPFAVDWRSVLMASLAASLALTIYMVLVPQWFGVDDMDLGLAISARIAPDGGAWAFVSRALWHLGSGAVGVVLYAAVMRYWQTQSKAASGAAFGAVFWLLLPMLLMPLFLNWFGMRQFGLFMLDLGHGWAPATIELGACLLHGTIAGAVYKHRALKDYWVGNVRYVTRGPSNL